MSHHLSEAVQTCLVGIIAWALTSARGFFVGYESFGLDKSARSDVVRVSLVVFVQDGMDHDGLSMNRQDRVCWHIDPIF